MRLVDDDRVVGREQRIALRFREQDAVGHQLDVRVGLRVIGEADLVADRVAEPRAELLRDSRRDCARGDPARLRVADQPALAAAVREAYLRKLRRLSRACLAADDHDRVVADGCGDLVRALRDRQFGWVRDRGAARRARCTAFRSSGDGGGDSFPFGGGSATAARPFDPAREQMRVGGHRRRKLRDEPGGGRSVMRGRRWQCGGADSTPGPRGGVMIPRHRRRARESPAPVRQHSGGTHDPIPPHAALAVSLAATLALAAARRRREDAALGRPRRHADDRPPFAEREPDQQYQPARLRVPARPRQEAGPDPGARRIVDAGQSDHLALQAAPRRQVPRRHAVHRRRRRVQLRARARRDVAIARVRERLRNTEEDRRPHRRVHDQRPRTRSSSSTSTRSTS